MTIINKHWVSFTFVPISSYWKLNQQPQISWYCNRYGGRPSKNSRNILCRKKPHKTHMTTLSEYDTKSYLYNQVKTHNCQHNIMTQCCRLSPSVGMINSLKLANSHAGTLAPKWSIAHPAINYCEVTKNRLSEDRDNLVIR